MTNKSYVGTAAFIVGGFIVSCLLLQWLIITGCIIFDLQANLLNILFISIVCAMVELLPVVDDNITVPLSAALLANLLF
jgi:dolichol kinase